MSSEDAVDTGINVPEDVNGGRPQEILSYAAPGYKNLQRIESGNIQETYAFRLEDEDYILQFSDSDQESLVNGISCLELLQNSEVPSPELVCYDLDEPYVITKRFNGRSSREVLLDQDKQGKKVLARRLGAELKRVHDTFEPNFYGDLGDLDDHNYEDVSWNEYFMEKMEDIAEDIIEFYPEHKNELEDVIRRGQETVPENPDAALIHNDYIPANILVNGDELRIIDWDMAHSGDALFDVSGAAESLRVFTEEYEDDVDKSFISGYGIEADSELINTYRMLARAGMMHAAEVQKDNNSGGFRDPELHISRIEELLETGGAK